MSEQAERQVNDVQLKHIHQTGIFLNGECHRGRCSRSRPHDDSSVREISDISEANEADLRLHADVRGRSRRPSRPDQGNGSIEQQDAAARI